MLIDWPRAFDDWLDRIDSDVAGERPHARAQRAYVLNALSYLQDLTEPPSLDQETATLKWVRQSRRYQLWRVSHPYDPHVAIRLICWFPPGQVVPARARHSGGSADGR